MKKKIFPLAIVALSLIWMMACEDNTFKEFTPPSIKFRTASKPIAKSLTDSVKSLFKTTYKVNTTSFQIYAEDPEGAELSKILYTIEGGDGQVLFNSIDLTGEITGISAETWIDLQFRVSDQNSVGEIIVSFIGINKYGVKGEPSKYTIIVFDNLPPKAEFFIRSGDLADGLYARIMDASNSFDGDEIFGGEIKTFEYTVKLRDVTFPVIRSYNTTSKTTPIVFPKPGLYTVTLITYDEQPAASEPFNVLVEIK